MHFGMLIATTFLSLPPMIREMAPFGREELACQVPEECWLLPDTEFGEVEFPLTLTISHSISHHGPDYADSSGKIPVI